MRVRLTSLLVLGSLAVSMPLAAQSSYKSVKGMDERFRLDVGGFFQSFDTTVRYDPADGSAGTEVNLEDDLGLDDQKASLRVDGYWRFGKRASLVFGYQTFRRANERTLSREIVFGDEVFQVGAQVDTRMKTDVGEVYYSYSLLNTGEAEISLMLGVSAFFNRISLEASGSVSGGGGGASGSVSQEVKEVIAPIPAIGAHARYTLLPGFFVHGRVKWMKATISDYEGSMLDLRAGLDVYFNENFGIGAAWDVLDLTFEKKTDRSVALDYSYDGPIAYLSFAF